VYARIFRRFVFGVYSKGNKRIATIASRMSEKRTAREIWLWIHDYNRGIDESRGVAQPDFLKHYWTEQEIHQLAGNVDGPVPGGNLMIPPEVNLMFVSPFAYRRNPCTVSIQSQELHMSCSLNTIVIVS